MQRNERLNELLQFLDAVELQDYNCQYADDVCIFLHTEITREKKRLNSRRKNSYLDNLIQTQKKQYEGFRVNRDTSKEQEEFRTFVYNFKQDVEEALQSRSGKIS